MTTSSSAANDTAAASETRAALGRHLQSFAQGIETILADYTNASVIVIPDTTYRGLDEIRGFFRRFLDSATPEFWDALCRRWGSDGRIAKTDVALRGMRH